RVGGLVYLVGRAGRLAAEQQDVAAPKHLVNLGHACARGEQYKPRACAAAPILEWLPARMTHDGHLIEIVHTGSRKGAVGGGELCWRDDMRCDARAGRQPQNGPGVLGDIGLKQRNAQGWGHACTRSDRLVLSAGLAARIVVATEGNPTGQARSAVTGCGPRSSRHLAQKPAGSKRVMRLLVI